MSNTYRLFLAAVLVLSAAGALVSPAHASVTAQTECEADGGDWAGDGGSMTTGTCTYPPGSTGFTAAGCNPETDAYVTEEWVLDVSQGYGACVANPANPAGGQNRNSTQGNDESTTLTLPGGKNGYVIFPPGACPQNCTIGPQLPNGANTALTGDELATLYVRGTPPFEGSYTVCFENPDGDTLTIYRYVGGVWTAIQVAATNPICVSASGDGAFYLGG